MGITGQGKKWPFALVVLGAAVVLFTVCMVLRFGLGLSLLLTLAGLIITGIVVIVRAVTRRRLPLEGQQTR